MPRVGVLALQGDFALHAELLRELGVDVQLVRRAAELESCQALVLPGGESTTLARLLDTQGLRDTVSDFVRQHPVLGTCAGCILLAAELEDAGGVEPLSRLDIRVRRNGFGRQVDSFEAPIVVEGVDPATAPRVGSPVAFIRAPRITRVGESATVWGRWSGEVVAVREGTAAALTFHPEVIGDPSWHEAWLKSAGLLADRGSLDGLSGAF
jgi:5'-phosphate synthase pdxT subunit